MSNNAYLIDPFAVAQSFESKPIIRDNINTIETVDAQIKTIEDYFNFLSIESPYIKYEEEMLVA